MATYGSGSAKIEFDVSTGGALGDMSAYLRENCTIDREAKVVEGTPFGASWAAKVATGMKEMAPVELTGWYDDTATTGPEVVFFNAGAALGATRTLKVTYGGTKTTSVETIIQKFQVQMSVGSLHVFKVTLVPTGTVTEV